MALSDMRKNIKHVVHLMFENRGFDHVLGWLYSGGSRPSANIPWPLRSGEQPFYGLPEDGNGNPTLWFPACSSFYQDAPYTGPQKYVHKGLWGNCYMPAADPGEGWDDVTRQIFGPDSDMKLPVEKRMRGFYIDYAKHGIGPGSDDDILATGTPDDLPVLNGLAKAYAVSDTWFASAPTETNPNRAFSLAGTSAGRMNNNSFDGNPFPELRTIFGVLNDTRHPWKLYASNTWDGGRIFTQYMFPQGMDPGAPGFQGGFGLITDFEQDVINDTLPVFSYLEPDFSVQAAWNPFGNDYHPPGSVHSGEIFLQYIYNLLARRCPEVFRKTLLIVTFDEHGGTLDHVPPPDAVPPDLDSSNTFGRYGVRVPTILISPWVRPGCVFRASYYPDGEGEGGTPFDHTSVLATLCKWLDIPYTRTSDVGWLQSRTAIAPTFEDVFIDTCNDGFVDVKPFICAGAAVNDSIAGHGTNSVRALVTRVTDFRRGDPRHEAIIAEASTTCQTTEDLGRLLLRLRREHGKKQRQGT